MVAIVDTVLLELPRSAKAAVDLVVDSIVLCKLERRGYDEN